MPKKELRLCPIFFLWAFIESVMCVLMQVCLSLLNTWNGRRTEQWDPTSSTILQVRPSRTV